MEDWQEFIGWPSTAKVYRLSASQSDVYQLVRQPSFEGVPEDCIPGRRKTTSNFDRPKGFIGGSNLDNFDTADSWRTVAESDMRARDIIFIDNADWLEVSGEPQRKILLPRHLAYIVTTPPPAIVEGYWGE